MIDILLILENGYREKPHRLSLSLLLLHLKGGLSQEYIEYLLDNNGINKDDCMSLVSR